MDKIMTIDLKNVILAPFITFERYVKYGFI